MSRTKENTFEATLAEAISTGSQMIARAYIQAIVQYLEELDKPASDVSFDELLEQVNLPTNIRPGMNAISPAKGLNSHTSRRGKAPAKAKLTSKANSERYFEKDGPPPEGFCGYVRRYGDSAGTYCPKESDGIVYQLVEGPRSFCIQCKSGKQQVKDIVAGTSNTLIQQKARGNGRKGKKNVDNLPEKPGDFMSAVPGEESVYIHVVPYGNDGLLIVRDTPHVLWSDGNGHCLVASLNGKDIVPPTEESKSWALDNSLQVLELPDLFDDQHKDEEPEDLDEESNLSQKDETQDNTHQEQPEAEPKQVEELQPQPEPEPEPDSEPESIQEEEVQPPPKKVPSLKPKTKTGTVTAKGARAKPAVKPTAKNTLMKVPGM